MPFLDDILGVFPNSVQELKAHCIRLDVKDYDRVESLLGDTVPSSGLDIEWREAVFRLLDGIFAHFKFSHRHTDDRLDVKLFPFTTYYCSLLLTRMLEDLSPTVGILNNLKRGRIITLLQEIQREIMVQGYWSQIEVLVCSLSARAELKSLYMKVEALLNVPQKAIWIDFVKCLEVADHYDMSRKVYQWRDQENVRDDIRQLSLEDRGEVLDLWQSVIDDHVGEYEKLKQSMFEIMKESHSLPNSTMLCGIELKSRETVHEGSYADMYKVAQDRLSMDEVTTMMRSRSCFIGSARQWPECIKSTDNLKLFNDTSAAQLLSEDTTFNNTDERSLEPVPPLKQSANRWLPLKLKLHDNSPEVVDRKVRALLNKLTMENFESISNQIISWANKSVNEKDGRTLIQVTRLVLESATNNEILSEMYARLCRKVMEKISPDVQDDGIRNSDNKPITGGLLFRKYLLNPCQEDFQRGWTAKKPTAAAAAAKATEDKTVAEANENLEKKDEAALYSEEYYAAQKAKRQGLGLAKFIGELFKLQMLTERIMHECIKKLLSNVDNPEEEEIESLCKLLITVGQSLDTAKARGHMDIYIERMKGLAYSNNVSSHMRHLLLDIIDLRGRRWIPRYAVTTFSTLAQVAFLPPHSLYLEMQALKGKPQTLKGDTRNRFGRGRIVT